MLYAYYIHSTCIFNIDSFYFVVQRRLFLLRYRAPSIGMQFRRSQICNRALMRVRNLLNSVKRNDEKNTVNSWRLS